MDLRSLAARTPPCASFGSASRALRSSVFAPAWKAEWRRWSGTTIEHDFVSFGGNWVPDGGGEGGGGRGWSGTAIAHDDLSFACGSGKGAARGRGREKEEPLLTVLTPTPTRGRRRFACSLSVCIYTETSKPVCAYQYSLFMCIHALCWSLPLHLDGLLVIVNPAGIVREPEWQS